MVALWQDPDILSDLGLALTKLENYANPWFAFDHAIKQAPYDLNIVRNYLLCLLESADFRKFETIFKKTKAFTPAEANKMKAISIEYKSATGFLDSQDEDAAFECVWVEVGN